MEKSMYQLIMEKRMLDENDGEISELYFNDPFFYALCVKLSENARAKHPVNENEYVLACIVELWKLTGLVMRKK